MFSCMCSFPTYVNMWHQKTSTRYLEEDIKIVLKNEISISLFVCFAFRSQSIGKSGTQCMGSVGGMLMEL